MLLKNPIMPVRRASLPVSILLLVCLADASANHVRCTCPSVSARATGSSSCSTSEVSGLCTVAFNEFDNELEDAALSLLKKAAEPSLSVQFHRYPPIQRDGRGFSLAESQSLFRQSPAALVDQLVVYALVSLVDMGKAEEQLDSIRQLHRLLRQNAGSVGQAFAFGAGPIRSREVIIKHGCISFTLDTLWSMYKSEWSGSVSAAQCE